MKLLIFCFLLIVFKANGWYFDQFCHFEVTQQYGLIYSPNYPGNYPTPMICTYKINRPQGQGITLSISDIDFGWNETDKDSNDRLSIFDGDNDTFKTLAVLYRSNYFIPAVNYTSRTNQLLLKLETFYNRNTHRGFHAVYKSIDFECGGLYTYDNGIIRHPKYGTQYGNFENCKWTVQAPPGHIIKILWGSFITESADKLKIREWVNGHEYVLFDAGGNLSPSPIISTDRTIYLDFVSDASVVGSGFSLNYTFENILNSNIPQIKN